MGISGWQLILILVIVFVLFGAGKLPRVMGDLGRGVRSMKDGLNGNEEGDAAKKIDSDSSASVAHDAGASGRVIDVEEEPETVKKPAKKVTKKRTVTKKAPAKKAPAKTKSTAKKTTAKKPATKKTAAKKSTAKKKS